MTTKWTWRLAYITCTGWHCVLLFGGAWMVEMRAPRGAPWFLWSYGFFVGVMAAWGSVGYLERTARKLHEKNSSR